MRKFISFALCALMIVCALAGCGKSSAKSEASGSADSTVSAEEGAGSAVSEADSAASETESGESGSEESAMFQNPEESYTKITGKIDENGNVTEFEVPEETAEEAEGSAETESAANAAAPAAETAAAISFSPYHTENTDPDNFIQYTEIMWNGEYLEDESVYDPWYDMHFGTGDTYTDVEGIVTFRGNNFRDNPTYGSTGMTEYAMEKVWERTTGSLESHERIWSGNGWTGQPLMMKWPASTKAVMNMYDSAKAKDDLVEVIYASMDGMIYFLDLETGEATRDPIYMGITFKGAGALDPRGYPLMYVGAGYDADDKQSRVFVISLIDGSVLYTFGNGDEFSLRGSLSYFDSSALVDAASDTLIYPGENGILYLIKLNTKYDEAAGTISIDPGDRAKWRYKGMRSDSSSYWLGMEDSACVYDGYLFIADNGGYLMCLDLSTLQLVWAQNVLDDTNDTPVLSIEDGHLYLYISTSFHLGWRSDSTADIPIWKIDAENGEILWHTDYECFSQSGLSGGVQSTIANGKGDLADYIYVTVAMTGEEYGGVLACIKKDTGEVLWEHRAVYTWSSPVCLYGADGTGKVLYFSAAGKGYLLDGKTGETEDVYDPGESTFEASPAVYEDMLVVGTRDCYIWGIRLK